MRTTLPILFGVLSTGLAAGLLISRFADAPSSAEPSPPLRPSRSAASISPEADPDGASKAAIAELSLELAALRTRVAELEQPSSREAVLSQEEPAPSSSETTGPIPSADERAKILTVMQQLEDERRHEKELARAEKQQAEFLRRATRLSEQLALPAGSEQRIASILAGEDERVGAVREQFQGLGKSQENRQAFKEALQATRTWRDEELSLSFGPQVVEQLQALEQSERGKDRRRGK
jgi:hypothetical protein